MAKRKAPKRPISNSIGHCIYCGVIDADLHDEHIIPAALNGTWVLPQASCRDCETITSRIERRVLRGVLLKGRTALEFFTRNPDRRPATLPIAIDGVETQVPTEEYPIGPSLLEFVPPGFHVGKIYPPGVHVRAHGQQLIQERLMRLAQTTRRSRALRPSGAEQQRGVQIRWSNTYDFGELQAFLQMLVKIAYCAVIGRHGAEAVNPQYARPLIRGSHPFLSHFVGSVPLETPLEELPNAATREEMPDDPGKPHEFHRISPVRRRGMWHVYIQLFRIHFGGNPPIYHVIVGEAC